MRSKSFYFIFYLILLFVRFVAALMNRAEVDELQYTTNMINTNFSNYSAWHNRRYDLIAIKFWFLDLFLVIKIGIGFQLFSE